MLLFAVYILFIKVFGSFIHTAEANTIWKLDSYCYRQTSYKLPGRNLQHNLMEYDTADRYIDQLDYYQLMSEITEHQYSETGRPTCAVTCYTLVQWSSLLSYCSTVLLAKSGIFVLGLSISYLLFLPEFDPYFPSTMAEQHYDRYSDELQACQTSMHQALSTESSCYTPYIDSQQCLSTPTFDFSAPNFGYNSLRADTLYSSMPLSNESTTEAPQSPAESSSSGSNSETESTGTPDKFSRHTSRTKRQSRAKSSSCARRTSKYRMIDCIYFISVLFLVA